jgi:threonine dehydrogenase-like Zn-dependent dehydrogenase
MRAVAVTGHKEANLIEAPELSKPLGATEVYGRTLASLISPGTELNWAYLSKEGFPKFTGYAAVFEVTEVGAEVKDLPVGTVVFGTGSHRDDQKAERKEVAALPAGLDPAHAVFARLMGVSMSTLNTTTAHAPSRVLITGLGPVGNLAAQIFTTCGFEVTAVDPVEERRVFAKQCGLTDVRAAIGEGTPITDKVRLHLECSGHEQAAMDGIATVGKCGEVVLMGTPWVKRTDLSAYELLRAVFHRYAVLRSGWEWQVPGQPVEFGGHSIIENFEAALKWIAEGKVKIEGLATLFAPKDAQKAYGGLLDQSLPTVAAVFDWRG